MLYRWLFSLGALFLTVVAWSVLAWIYFTVLKPIFVDGVENPPDWFANVVNLITVALEYWPVAAVVSWVIYMGVAAQKTEYDTGVMWR